MIENLQSLRQALKDVGMKWHFHSYWGLELCFEGDNDHVLRLRGNYLAPSPIERIELYFLTCRKDVMLARDVIIFMGHDKYWKVQDAIDTYHIPED